MKPHLYKRWGWWYCRGELGLITMARTPDGAYYTYVFHEITAWLS